MFVLKLFNLLSAICTYCVNPVFQLIDVTDIIDDYNLLPENLRDMKKFTAKALIIDSTCEVSIAVRPCIILFVYIV